MASAYRTLIRATGVCLVFVILFNWMGVPGFGKPILIRGVVADDGFGVSCSVDSNGKNKVYIRVATEDGQGKSYLVRVPNIEDCGSIRRGDTVYAVVSFWRFDMELQLFR